MKRTRKKVMQMHWKFFSFILLAPLMLFCSCAIGDDATPFTSDVQNSTMTNPDSLFIGKNAAETELTISWRVKPGAKGYEFTLYNVDDPENPVAVGEEKELVDGISVTRPLSSDTKYSISIRTIGNTEYNNTDAAEAAIFSYSTLVPAVATIPSGTNLTEFMTQWFTDHPFGSHLKSDGTDSLLLNDSTEIAFELEKGGQYTMTGPIDFGNFWVTFRGNKVIHSTVNMSGDATFMTTCGLKLKFMDINCADATSKALLTMSATPNPLYKGKGNNFIIPADKPIVISNCNVYKLPSRIMYDNGLLYCPAVALIKDCMMELTTTDASQISYIEFTKSFINDMTLQNNTFYYDGTKGQNNYFVRYNGSGRPDRAGFTNAYLNYTSNTFYNVCNTGKFGDYNSFARNTIHYTIKKNIFSECGNGQICRRILAGRSTDDANIVSDVSQNTYEYNGTIGEANDKTGTALSTAPNFVDPANANFTPQGADQLTYRTGDTRWLPAPTETK